MTTRRLILPAAGLLASSLAGYGQQGPKEDFVIATPPTGVAMMQGTPGVRTMQSIQVIAADHAENKVVKNAPYSAEATTETTRMLADGTRIVNRHSTSSARDKEGRTRRDSDLGSLPVGGQVQAPRIATIVDPNANETIILNINERTAQKLKSGATWFTRSESSASSSHGTKEVHEERMHVTTMREGATAALPVPAPAFPMAGIGAAGAVFMRYDSKNSKSENLGKQTMEGLQVEGTRITDTIPAGEIGNDRAIQSVTERWYSPELQMVIYSKTNDPQSGETIYRVSNVRRSEPSPDLFKIPADFKIQEGPSPMKIMMRKAKEAKE